MHHTIHHRALATLLLLVLAAFQPTEIGATPDSSMAGLTDSLNWQPDLGVSGELGIAFNGRQPVFGLGIRSRYVGLRGVILPGFSNECSEPPCGDYFETVRGIDLVGYLPLNRQITLNLLGGFYSSKRGDLAEVLGYGLGIRFVLDRRISSATTVHVAAHSRAGVTLGVGSIWRTSE